MNKDTMKEKIDPDVELDKMDGNNGDENPYRELILDNASKIANMLSQMEQWSILSNVINYVQSIKPINKSKINVRRKGGEKDM